MHGRNVILFYLLATFPLAYIWRDFKLEKFKFENVLMTILCLILVTANTAVITILLKECLDDLYLPLEILLLATIIFVLYILLFLKVEGRILHPTILQRKNLSLLVTFLIASGIFIASLNTNKTKPDETYTDAIKFLLRTERPENISLYVPQGIGGLAGSFGIKYYIDSRSEVFLPANNGQKNIFEEYIDFSDGKIYYKDFFNRYNFTHIIITSKQAFLFSQLSDDKNFRVIYESEHVEGYKVIRCKIFIPPRKD